LILIYPLRQGTDGFNPFRGILNDFRRNLFTLGDEIVILLAVFPLVQRPDVF
jgi:hypothetical protein